MTVQLAPSPIFQAFGTNGTPLAFGQLFTYGAGTSTPQATWIDATQTTQNTNPIILNAFGQANIWLATNLAYKFVLQDQNGNQLWAVDQIGQQFQIYPRIPAEITAGVIPVNFSYPAGTVDRYGNNTIPGTTDMFGAIQTANTVATLTSGKVTFIPGELYGVNITANGGSLSMTADWVCDGPYATVQRIDFGTTTAYFFVTALGVNNLLMRGLHFDGQVTTSALSTIPNQDLGAVGSYADNGTESLWTKPYGVLFRSTQYCTVDTCLFTNFLRAGLRFDTGNISGAVGPPVSPPIPPYASGVAGDLSLGNVITNCRTVRTRGVFGDGFLAVDTESTKWSNCYVYDYQRIGFCTDITTVGEMGMQYVNCTAEYGHDAVTSAVQSNVGFWIESGDGVSYSNCESKSTSVGFEFGSAASQAAGIWRPYTGTISATGCKAVRNNSSGFKINCGQRDVHVVIDGCFAEVNSTAATYSASVGVGSNAYQVSFLPASGGPNGTANVSCHVEIRASRADMVAMSAITTAAAFNCFNGAVTNGQQLEITLDGLSTKWLTAAGANDTAAVTAYESTAGSNFGYFGDVIFSGAHNGGTRFGGFAKIISCTNETGGTVMLSSELGNGNAVMEIANTRVSLRTGGATTNLGSLIITGCDLVDYRGQVGFEFVTVTGCNFADMDVAHKDRSVWGSNGSTIFQLSNCTIYRNLEFSSGQGTSSSHYPTTSFLTGCVWRLQYQVEPGLTILKPGGDYASLLLSGCTFIDTGSTSSTNPMILVNTTDQNVKIAGAGNVFDNTYLSVAGGHVITVNATSNDAPQTVGGVIVTVLGVLIALS